MSALAEESASGATRLGATRSSSDFHRKIAVSVWPRKSTGLGVPRVGRVSPAVQARLACASAVQLFALPESHCVPIPAISLSVVDKTKQSADDIRMNHLLVPTHVNNNQNGTPSKFIRSSPPTDPAGCRRRRW